MEHIPAHLLDGRPIEVAFAVATACATAGWNRQRTWSTLVKLRPDVGYLVTSWPGIWAKSIASAGMAELDAAGSSPRAVQQARRLVAHLLAPVADSNRGTAAARRATAVVGVELLRPRTAASGAPETFRAVQISALRVGTLTGVANATPALRQAVQRGWLREQARRGTSPIWKLAPVHGKPRWGEPVWAAVDRLAGLDVTAPMAEVVMSASHPVWDALGDTVWVRAMTRAAFDTVPAPLSRPAISKADATLAQHGFPLEPEAFWHWADDTADELGATARRAELTAAAEARTQERLASLAAVRAVRALIPPAPAGVAQLGDWFEVALRVMQAHPEHVADIRRTLLKRAAKHHMQPLGLWRTWLVRQWVERAPVDADDEQRERQRRAAVAPLVVQALDGVEVAWPNQTAAAVGADGVEWCTRKGA